MRHQVSGSLPFIPPQSFPLTNPTPYPNAPHFRPDYSICTMSVTSTFSLVFCILFALVAGQCKDICHRKPKWAYKNCRSGGKKIAGCEVIRCANPTFKYRGYSCSNSSTPNASVSPTPTPQYTQIARGCLNVCRTKAVSAWHDCFYQKKRLRGCRVARCDTDELPYKGWACAPM